MVSRAASSYRGAGKTDTKDAHVIADQARMRRDLTVLCGGDEAGQGCVLANPVFERIAHPAIDAAGGGLQPCGSATLGSRPFDARLPAAA
jgi:Transposase